MTGDQDAEYPPFENPFAAEASAEERVYSVILQTRAPQSVPAIADRAGCDPKTARKYLDWFARLGIVTEHDGDPVTYQRNDRYFEWRRIDALATEYSPEELEDRVRALTERIRTYEKRYEATHPAAVNALAPPEDITTETAFADLTDWATTREELHRHERARQLQANERGVTEV